MLACCIQYSVTAPTEPCFNIKYVSTNAKVHVVAYFQQTVFSWGYITVTFQPQCLYSVESLKVLLQTYKLCLILHYCTTSNSNHADT